MIGNILTARAAHAITAFGIARALRTEAEYADQQERFLKIRRRMGVQVQPHISGQILTAYVNGGVWLVRCGCGNSPATDPAWRVAYCFECGARYTQVIFPVGLEAIEAVLLARQRRGAMNWEAPETLDDLRRENVAHGIEVTS